jgi:hypothetical protein
MNQTPLILEEVPNAEIKSECQNNERRFLALLFKGKAHLEKALAAGITPDHFQHNMLKNIFGCMAKYYREHNALLGGDTYEAILHQRVSTPEEISRWMDEYYSIVRLLVTPEDFGFLSQYLQNTYAQRYAYTLTHRYFDLLLRAKDNQGELVAEFQRAVANIPQAGNNGLPVALPLDQFSHGDDNGGNLLGNRFLCRGGGLLLAAPTGIGKTSWALQAAISWSLGLDHLGIKPASPLTSLFIQAENDSGDLAELRNGIFEGMGLTPEQIDTACQRVKIVCETSKTGPDFVAMVEALVAKDRHDLLWVDPLFSYLGADVCDQEKVSGFLRNGLNPILQKYNCGLVLVHHTNKPQKGNDKADFRAGDFAYFGTGTNELANWARAVIAIRNIGEHDAFEMILGKRGQRAGLKDEWQQPIYSVFIHHSKTGICWTTGEAPKGKKTFSKLDVLNLVPFTGSISKAKFDNDATDAGLPQKRMRGWIAELVEDGSLFVWEIPRPGVRPSLAYSRQEQPKVSQVTGKVTGNEKPLPITHSTQTDELVTGGAYFSIGTGNPTSRVANRLPATLPAVTGEAEKTPNSSNGSEPEQLTFNWGA